MQPYKAVIIGCGSIGANKPDKIDFPDSANILTHAHAVYRHPRTELLGIVDTDNQKLMTAKAKWSPQLAVRSYDEILSAEGKAPDIIIMAVPTKYHYDVLHEIFLSTLLPKLIIAEKPFCPESNQARAITESYSGQNVSIMIDYIRRYAAKYQEIKKKIDNNDFGKALNARVLYTRGLKHESCHGIDLLRYFFGECTTAQNLSGLTIFDRTEDDLSKPVWFNFEKCENVIFQPCNGRQYGIFEIDICFEQARLRFIDNGLQVEVYSINPENEWGHKSLDYNLTTVIRQETGLNTALYNLIDNAVNFLDGKQDLICTAEDAIKVHEILEKLK
jgi:predicted dehydrogenase